MLVQVQVFLDVTTQKSCIFIPSLLRALNHVNPLHTLYPIS
jgi:hypothetical protein